MSERSYHKGSSSKLNSSLSSIKLKIHSFAGKDDPEAFLEWADKLDNNFSVTFLY